MGGIADRRREMLEIERVLEDDGFSFLLIEGPEGVGKTTLLREIMRRHSAMHLSCTSGSDTMSEIRELAKSVSREDILSEAYGEVLSVYGIHRDTGILIGESSRKGGLDGDLFAGMLSAVQSFVRDSLSMISENLREGYLSSLGYGEYRIVIARGRYIDLVAIVKGMEEYSLKNELVRTLSEFEEIYGHLLDNWDGNVSKIPLSPMLEKFFSPNRGEIAISSALHGFLALMKEHIVAIDDAQWLSTGTLEFLRLLTIKAAGENVGKIIITVNSDEPLPPLLEDTLASPFVRRIALGNLDLDSTVEFVEFHYPDNLFSQEFLEKLHRCTSGNPLRIVELMDDLVRRGVVRESDGFWTASPFSCDSPAKVIPDLTEEEREILGIAAEIGFITGDFITEVLEVKRIKAFRFLRRMEKLGILEKRAGEYVFSHESIRKEALYLGEEDRREMLEVASEYYIEKGEMGRAARILEKFSPEKAATIYEEIARNAIEERRMREAAIHLSRAYNLSGRVEDITVAGKILLKLGDFSTAARMLEGATDSLEALDIYVTANAFLGKVVEVEDEFLREKARAIASFKTGNFKEALARASNALNIREDFTLAVVAWECSAMLGHADEKYLQIAERCAEDDLDRLLLSRKRMVVLLDRGKVEEIMKEIDGYIDLAKKAGSYREVAAMLNIKAEALNALAFGEEAMNLYFQALRYAEMQDDLNLTSIILGNIALKFMASCEYSKALKYQRKVLRIFELAANRHGIAFTKLDMGLSHLLMGEWDNAREYLRDAVKELGEIGDISTEIYTRYFLLASQFALSGDCAVAGDMLKTYLEFRKLEEWYAMGDLARVQVIVDEICGTQSPAWQDLGKNDKSECEDALIARLRSLAEKRVEKNKYN